MQQAMICNFVKQAVTYIKFLTITNLFMSNLNKLCNIFIEKLKPIVDTDIIILLNALSHLGACLFKPLVETHYQKNKGPGPFLDIYGT